MGNIIVVGGAGGVGLAIVNKLIARGDRVSVSVLDDREEALVREQAPGTAAIHRLDLSNADCARTQATAALAAEHSIDAVIVAAAISPYGPLETAPISLLRRTLEINCISGIAIYQAAMPALRRSRGRIIFMSSMAGEVGFPFIGPYVASKFALEGAIDSMRREAKPHGVDVVVVQPGSIRTPMAANQIESLTAEIARLGEEDNALYGALYKAFLALAKSEYENSASSAEDVADIAMTAIDTPGPKSRYIAGADAQYLISFGKNNSDEAIDAMFAETLAKAGVA